MIHVKSFLENKVSFKKNLLTGLLGWVKFCSILVAWYNLPALYTFAEVMKGISLAGLWCQSHWTLMPISLDSLQVLLAGFAFMALNMSSQSRLFFFCNLWNFLNYMVPVLRSIVPSPIAQQMLFVTSALLLGLNSSVSSWIRPWSPFICLSNHKQQTNAQCIGTWITKILQSVPSMTWIDSVTWYTHCKLVDTKILQNFDPPLYLLLFLSMLKLYIEGN